jgi:hypothetical protein
MNSNTHRHISRDATHRPGRLFILAVFVALAVPIAVGGASETGPNPGDAPGGYRLLDESGIARFPFEIYRGDIRFRAQINGHDTHLLLDDGFMWDPILFWGSPEVDALGLVRDGELSIGGENDENAIASTTASGITIRLPGVEFNGQTAVITPYSSGTSIMWEGSIGQVSATFFKHFVVDINFDTMMITMIPPDTFEYEGRGSAVAWKPLEIGAWSIPGKLQLADGSLASMEFLVDLGYNDQAQIATGREHGIQTPEKSLPASLGFNIKREEIRGHLGRAPRIEIGDFALEDVLASYVVEDQSDDVFHEVMIGLGLLSRFNLVFDYSRRRLFVEPNDSFGDTFEHNMSGLLMRREQENDLRVLRVYPGSPAAAAGVKAEDRIKEIDGKPAANFGFWKRNPYFKREGETVEMVIVRDDEELEISFVLRRVI